MSPTLTACLVVLAVCALDFTAMAWDKFQATRGGRRVPELWLHGLELLGGWPGSFLAMALVRHKRRKPRFWLVTLAIAAFHVTLAGLWLAGR